MIWYQLDNSKNWTGSFLPFKLTLMGPAEGLVSTQKACLCHLASMLLTPGVLPTEGTQAALLGGEIGSIILNSSIVTCDKEP